MTALKRLILPALMLCLVFAPALGAQEKTALAIMTAVYERPQPADMSATLTMTLVDSKGKERINTLFMTPTMTSGRMAISGCASFSCSKASGSLIWLVP